MERISITLEKEDIERLDEIANNMDRTRSDAVRQLIKEYSN